MNTGAACREYFKWNINRGDAVMSLFRHADKLGRQRIVSLYFLLTATAYHVDSCNLLP